MDGTAMPAGGGGVAARIAHEAFATAVRRLCRGGSWEALPRELAWLVVQARELGFEAIEPLAGRAEEQLARLVEEATAIVSDCAAWSWRRHLEAHPGDSGGAAVAASSEAGQEARRVLALVYLQVLEALDHSVGEEVAALDERAPRGRPPHRRLPGRPPLPPTLVVDDVRRAEAGWGSMVA
ncbi:MAG: hypothetical protein ACXVZ1_11500 [Gaiellaceae bacterium]